MADDAHRDNIETEIDGTRVKVQRRSRASNSNQEVLFVHVYDDVDGFGRDYSQYQFLVTEEDHARRARFMRKKTKPRPSGLAVRAVHEAGFEVEGIDTDAAHARVLDAHEVSKEAMGEFEGFPVAENLLSDAVSLLGWVATFHREVFTDDGDPGRFTEQNIETEEDLYRVLAQPEEAARFYETFNGNPMAVAILRTEVLTQYGFDMLETVEDAPQAPTTIREAAETDPHNG